MNGQRLDKRVPHQAPFVRTSAPKSAKLLSRHDRVPLTGGHRSRREAAKPGPVLG